MSAPAPDELLTFADVARALPKDSRGRRVATSTIWRWANKGLGGRRLRCIRMGRRSATTWPWLLEFFGEGSDTAESAANQPNVAARRRATEQALDRWGV